MLKLMGEETMPNETRSIEVAVDIAAPADVVWKALTDPAELVRWFPLQSAVTPGRGGTMKWAWDDKWTWESKIDIWEPQQRLRLVQDEQRPFDVEGGVLPPGEVAAAHMLMDFTLETVAGQTRLRLVHSGFGRGAAWDDEIDGVRVGWNAELHGLGFYLDRHRGKQRHSASAYLTRSESQETVWQKVSSAFKLSPTPAVPGQPYRAEVSTGDRCDGIVRHYIPNRDFTGTVRALDDGILRLGTHRAAGKTGTVVFVATWNDRHASAVRDLGTRTQKLLDGMFAS
ncbi:MAG: SRPBCC family protein [Gemmatimonadaceae bacterium]